MIVCAAAALEDGGAGVRFEVERAGRKEQAFAIRFQGRVRAYMNRCAHVPVELDWQPGHFFDSDKTLLICSTHGASYDPASGACVSGPCPRRSGLEPLAIEEIDGHIVLIDGGR